jgi:hypothetical protein
MKKLLAIDVFLPYDTSYTMETPSMNATPPKPSPKPVPPRDEAIPARPGVSVTSEVLKRLIDEVRLDEVRQTGGYNRTYHRHNR